MNTDRDILADLRRLDPATTISDGPLDARARADLARVLSQPAGAAAPGVTRSQPIRHRRALVLAAGVVVAASAVVVTGLPLPSQQTSVAYAATPPLLPFELGGGAPAHKAGAEIAAGAASSTLWAETPDRQVIRIESWSLSTRVDNKTVHSTVLPELREIHRNNDGSGSVRSVVGDGEGDQPIPAGTVIVDETFGPGEFRPMYAESFSSEPQVLLEQLKVGHPIDEYGAAELFVAVGDLYREHLPTPRVRAGLLTLLSTSEDVVSLGQVDDRRGRRGTAFAVDSDYSGLPTRYIMIFDDSDGRLMATESVLTERAGKLNVPVPSVISYELFNSEA